MARLTLRRGGRCVITDATWLAETGQPYTLLVLNATPGCSGAKSWKRPSTTSYRDSCRQVRCTRLCEIAFATITTPLHLARPRPPQSSASTTSWIGPGASSSTASTSGTPSARDVTKSPTRSARYAKPRPRPSQLIWSGVNRNSSTSRLLGKRRIKASDHGWSRGSSNTSRQRPCPRARSASWQFRVRRGGLSSRGWYWSGRRDSNPLPQPWEGRALPGELLPLGRQPSLGFYNRLRLRRRLGHHRPHQRRILLDQPVRVPRVRGRRDDVVLRAVRVRRHQHPPIVDEHLYPVRQIDPISHVPLHHRPHHPPLHLPGAERDRRAR